MIKIHVIGSGSKGNATLIYNENTSILIDFGVAQARLIEGLNEIGKNPNDIDFAFFTHDHGDHIKNYSFLPLHKCFSLKGTVPLLEENVLQSYKERNFKDFKVTPIDTSHDATNPCGYLLECDGEKVVYLTDSGLIPKKTLSYMNNATYYIIESNHDPEMLFNSGRPKILIDRIYGNKGHLSNEDSAYYLSGLIGENTKELILAHLSEDCNTEEIALNTYNKILSAKCPLYKNITIKCAKQWESVDL